MLRRCVWSRNIKNEEAIVRVGPQKKKAFEMTYLSVLILFVCFDPIYTVFTAESNKREIKLQ